MLPIRLKNIEAEHKSEIDNHPLLEAFNDKFGLMTKFNLIKLLIQSVLLRGNGFAYIERADDGTVRKHLSVLNQEESYIYAGLSKVLTEIASKKNPERDYEKIKKLLEEI